MKCTECKSCLVRTIYNNKIYNVCKLCKKVWLVVRGITTPIEGEEQIGVLKTVNLNLL